MYCFC